MELQTVSQVSRELGISTRMLRYYEQAGLVESRRQEGYAYRIYDEAAIIRLRQILLLRKLRIPLRQIGVILKNPQAVTATEIFRQNLGLLDEEITALSTIRGILMEFVTILEETTHLPLQRLLTEGGPMAAAIEALSNTQNRRGELTMEALGKAEKQLGKLSDVRILYLPPATVAAAHHVGDDPEQVAGGLLADFVRKVGLHRIKPDLRAFGFNHPNPVDETGYHGYEAWVTIPPDMEVPAPLIKKQFPGGLYAAHMIAFGSFNEWEWLMEWLQKSDQYEFAGDWSDQAHMCGLLDEHLNYWSHVELENIEPPDLQMDLLLPVRERTL